MSDRDLIFLVEKIGDGIRINNYSKYELIVSLIPTAPKRKYVDILVVNPSCYIFYEGEIDLSKVSFRLIKNSKGG